MCEPISIGIAVGASMGALSSAITGGDVLQGALIGGVTGGFTGGLSPESLGFGSLSGATGSSFNTIGSTLIGTGFNTVTTNVAGFAATSLLGGIVMGSLFPQPEVPEFSQQSPQVSFANSRIETTGSGGSQAAVSLAGAISRAKKRKLTQDDVSDLSIDTSSFAAQGLQLA